MKDTSPYSNVTVEVEVWQVSPRLPFPHRWEGRISFRPIDGGIAISVGNEYTGLLYGMTKSRVLRKAERIRRNWFRDREQRNYEAVTL